MRYELLKFLGVLFFISHSNSNGCGVFSIPLAGDKSPGMLINNFDWYMDSGVFVVNPRDLEKKAFDHEHIVFKRNFVKWTSKYGSLTVNQNGVGFPLMGMNEKGVYVTTLWDGKADYKTIGREDHSIDELQWVQYQLDKAGDLDAVIQNSKLLRIKPILGSVHYFACDLNECALIEFVKNSEPMINRSKKDKVFGVTNSQYPASMEYLEKFHREGRSIKTAMESAKSLDRFVLGDYLSKNIANNSSRKSKIEVVQDGFEALRLLGVAYVKNPDPEDPGLLTDMSLVVDQNEKTIYFKSKTQVDNKMTYLSLNLDDLDFNCRDNLQVGYFGSLAKNPTHVKFEDLDKKINSDVIESSMKIPGLKRKEKFMIWMIKGNVKKYPFSFQCADKIEGDLLDKSP